jgi:hypothetical protein
VARPTVLSAWDFTWLFATRPLSLGDSFRASGLKTLTLPVGRYFGQGKTAERYARSMLGVLFLGAPSLGLALAGGLAAAHVGISWIAVALGILLSLAFGLLIALVKDVAMGATAALIGATTSVGAFGLVYGGSLGASTGSTAIVVRGLFEGAAAGFFLGGYAALALRRPLRLQRVQLASILIPLLGFAFWAWRAETMRGAGTAVGCIAAFPLFALRVPTYPLEALAEAFLYWRELRTGKSTLERSPIFLQEVSYLPLPFLRAHIERSLETAPPLGRLALFRCLRLPAQEKWAEERLRRLMIQGTPEAGSSAA